MEDQFDDTLFDEDEFDEKEPSSQTASQQVNSSQPEPQNPPADTEDDLTAEVLKLRGISDPAKIKFQDESGAIVERSWDSLSKEEQINILADQHADTTTDDSVNLSEDEINLITTIRNSGMDVAGYMNTITPNQTDNQVQNVVEGMTDDDLYAFDLLNKVGSDNITDEELDQALENAKANEALFKKTVDSLRQQYTQQYENERAALANQQKQASEQRYAAFANAVNNQIDNFDSFAGQSIQLANEDKDMLSRFMLELDENGVSALGKALNNPAILTKAAFWLLNEDTITAELQQQVQDAYTRGFNAGKGDMLNKSKMVFKPKSTTKSESKKQDLWDSDDWD